jgi:5-methylcytosine-specific restriction enzyme A
MTDPITDTKAKRSEFSKATKQAALRRSGGVCEAVGRMYGLEAETRCTASLANGFEADHYPKSALDEGSNGLDNCVAVCKACHKFKTRTYDIPMQAKGRRIRRNLDPETRRKSKKPIPQPANPSWPKRTFPKGRKFGQ